MKKNSNQVITWRKILIGLSQWLKRLILFNIHVVYKSRNTQLFGVSKVVYHKNNNLSCIKYSCNFAHLYLLQSFKHDDIFLLFITHTHNCQVPCLTDYDYFNCCWSVSSRTGQSQLVTWPLPLPLLPPHAHNVELYLSRCDR